MSDLVLAETARFEEANNVMELFVQGKNATQIAKAIGVPRTRVVEHIEDWKKSSVGTEFLQDRVDELIAVLNEHYTRLIDEAYQVLADIKIDLQNVEAKASAPLYGQMNTTLKMIADLEAKRIDVLQKAGFMEQADLGDQFAEQEQQQQQLIDILHEVTADCQRCGVRIANEIARVTGKPPVVVVAE